MPDPAEESAVEAATQLLRIGWTRLRGYLDGGIDAWTGRLSSYPAATAGELRLAMDRADGLFVLDVRQQLEWDWGVIPGSRRVFLADLPASLDALPRDRPIWVICSNGHRAAIAASLLDRAGVPVRLVAEGGVGEWHRR